jgi:hypothetical protein
MFSWCCGVCAIRTTATQNERHRMRFATVIACVATAAIVLNQVQIAGRNPDLSRQIGLPQPQGLPAFTQTASGQGGQGHGFSSDL